MNPVELIEKKRDGKKLSRDEIQWLVESYTDDRIPDYQMSAMLMAVYFRGMDHDELNSLVRCMIDSGHTINLSSIHGMKIDKHSTGGVGDKVSLILAPLMAAAGVPVPMVAGRGLGHTGGTLDKLEAIPGFRVALSEEEFIRQLRAIGCVIMGQTDRIAPADRKLYALRDVTGTVPSIPLICSSIISKKKAEGADGLILDVKIGKGAFLNSRESTVELARTLVDCGNAVGIKTQALITNMDQPLGNTIGNWVETYEAINALQGHGPDDLMRVTLTLGSVMLVMAGKCKDYGEAFQKLQEVLHSGRPWDLFINTVEMQGGDVSVIEHPNAYPESKYQLDVKTDCKGIITAIDARQLGLAAMILGAGRIQKEDQIDPKAGICLYKKTGDDVQSGTKLMTLYTDKEDILDKVKDDVLQTVVIGQEHPEIAPLIENLITSDGETTVLSD